MLFSIVVAIILQSYQQGTRVPTSPNPPLYLLFSVFPNGCEVISHCGLDLHFSDDYYDEHLFIRLLAIYRSSLEKCPFKSFAH